MTDRVNASVELRMIDRREDAIVGFREGLLEKLEVLGITTESLIEALMNKPFFHEKAKVEGWMSGACEDISLHDTADVSLAVELIVAENQGKSV